MRVAGVKTLEEANRYLQNEYLLWWEREMTVEAVNPDDAHRPLDQSHNLAASLSEVETRQVRPDYTFRWGGQLYQIERQAVATGLRGANVRVEHRLDGTLAVRHGDRYLAIQECAAAEKPKSLAPKPKGTRRSWPRGSDWNKNFDLKKGPKIWQAGELSAAGKKRRRDESFRPGGVAGRQSSPCTGKCSARPAGKPVGVFALEHLRRSLPRHSIPAASNSTGALGRRF